MSKKWKKRKGSFDFKSDGNIEIIRWNENSFVIIESNAYGLQPVGSARRWIKGKGKQNIQQAAVITAYNRGMMWSWFNWPCIIRFEASDLWWKVVLVISLKCHQYCHCIQLAAVSYSFWWKLCCWKISEGTLWVSWSDNQTHASSVLILAQQRLTKWLIKWDMMQKFIWEVQTKLRFSMKSDNTITLLPQHFLYSCVKCFVIDVT